MTSKVWAVVQHVAEHSTRCSAEWSACYLRYDCKRTRSVRSSDPAAQQLGISNQIGRAETWVKWTTLLSVLRNEKLECLMLFGAVGCIQLVHERTETLTGNDPDGMAVDGIKQGQGHKGKTFLGELFGLASYPEARHWRT